MSIEIEKDIKNELAEMRQDIAIIKTTVTTLATKEELIAMKFDLLKWIIILMTVNTLTIVGAIIGVAKFIIAK